MLDKEDIKGEIQETLISNFIENKDIVEKEMNLLNVLISSFGGSEYTYDEYCGKRIEFETAACDEIVDIDVDKELTISPVEGSIIQNKAVRKMMENPKLEYEEILQEEYIKWQIQKCYDIDKKMFYQISQISSMKLLKNKIPEETWKSKYGYFVDICNNKAERHGTATAEANKGRHEQDIRSSMS
jgi:hypothetical protein